MLAASIKKILGVVVGLIVAVGAARREFDATLADVERFAFERLPQT